MEKVHCEIGVDAVILNIKSTKPKGLLSLFRKPVVEITAAYEEHAASMDDPAAVVELSSAEIADKSDFEKRQEFLGDELTFAMKEITISEQQTKIKELEEQIDGLKKNHLEGKKYNTPMAQMIYDELTGRGVLPEVSEAILNGIESCSNAESVDLNSIVESADKSIVSILNDCCAAEMKKDILMFIGPTGVGKTTTIAKIAADFMLNRGLNIGLITSDTYRIAAVEQLKLYGEILGVEVLVAYNENEMLEHSANLSESTDVVLIDTAGRSHKNEENINDLNMMLSAVPKDGRQVFLVLSLTTKYEDMLSIIDTYSKMTDFSLILTKWDETTQIGAILNLAYKLKRPIEYICDGQNVPQDIGRMNPEKIAKALLGLKGKD